METKTKNPAAVALGSIRSEKKAKSSAENGRKGGRPRKDRRIFKDDKDWIADLSPEHGPVMEDCKFTFSLRREAESFLHMVDNGTSTEEASYLAAGYKYD